MANNKAKLDTITNAKWHSNMAHKDLNEFLNTLDPRQERANTKLKNLVAGKQRAKAMQLVESALASGKVEEQAV